jgi:methanethiol S-methyltransferase
MPQERRPTLKLRLVSPVLMWLIVAVGVALAFHFVPGRALFHRTGLSVAVFALTVVNWLYFFGSVLAIHRQAARSAAAITHLVTTGVYAKVRHPIYSADILLAWGIFLMFPKLQFLVSAIWLTIILTIWMKLEESALIAKFGAEYEHYMSATPRFIPRYFRRR